MTMVLLLTVVAFIFEFVGISDYMQYFQYNLLFIEI